MGEVRAGGMIADVSADLNAGGLEITELVSRLRGGDIRALARAISIVEGGLPGASQLLQACRAHLENALRIGVSPAPSPWYW